MLISINELRRKFGVRPRGVLHVGAHEAEEANEYARHAWGKTIWVEMLPEKYAALREKFKDDSNNVVIHAACWEEDGVKLPLFRADNAMSSSLMKPEQHLASHPEVSFSEDGSILTSRLDSVLPKDAAFDFINFDIQGAELHALKGLGKYFAKVKWAYFEVNLKPLYEGCALLPELDSYLAGHGFKRVGLRMAYGNVGWGDAIYQNRSRLSAADIARFHWGQVRRQVTKNRRKIATALGIARHTPERSV